MEERRNWIDKAILKKKIERITLIDFKTYYKVIINQDIIVFVKENLYDLMEQNIVQKQSPKI